MPATDARADWQHSLMRAIREPVVLLQRLNLPLNLLHGATPDTAEFPLLVPESFLARMEPGNARDPLLRQVLPVADELTSPADYKADALAEAEAKLAPGLLKKYAGRALMIATGNCAVHCRYCFRRHYPYAEEPGSEAAWEPALAAFQQDNALREAILSGGDPLMLTDSRLERLLARLAAVSHLRRLRLHTRLPIVLPDRVTGSLIDMLRSSRLRSVVVVHANHPAEIAGDCADALKTLNDSGLLVLNQAVLLSGVNDNADTLEELSERLLDVGVLPYYLHHPDRVTGTAHFDVPIEHGRKIIEELRRRLPGYAVPQYVQEIPGAASKTPL